MIVRLPIVKFIASILTLALVAVGGGCSVGSSYGERTKAASAVAASETDPEIRSALELIERIPDSPLGYIQLAVSHIQNARKTGDFTLNAKAETAVNKALEIAPTNGPARKLKGSLLLTFHRFSEGLDYATQLNRDVPDDAMIYGMLTDANFELGNYAEAITAAQTMVDLKPNSSSYARVAHIRSIYGDHDGSIEMYKVAARTSDPKDAEAQSWCLVQLGDEYFKYGNFVEAEKVYDEALSILPGYYMGIAAKGKVRAAQNDFDAAEKLLSSIIDRIPNVDSAIILGDIYTKKGDSERARSQYDLAELMESRIGINTDQKRLAMMWADQDRKLPEALEIATREFAARKDIYTADTLAWTQFKSGKFAAAKESITQAMRTKGSDARTLFHAGMIEKALGNRKEAIRLLESAIKLNPAFDVIQADNAKRTLAELQRGAA